MGSGSLNWMVTMERAERVGLPSDGQQESSHLSILGRILDL